MEKLLTLINHLKGNILNNIVHLELASIGSINYMKHILESVFKYLKSKFISETKI